MSDDLVKRLRGIPLGAQGGKLAHDAANEIERLQREHIVQVNLCLTANQRAEAAEAKVAKLREALAFYADRETWKGQFLERPIDKDCDGDFVAVPGKRARQALTETEDKDNE